MKLFLSLCLIMFGSMASASLKVSTQVNAYEEGHNPRPSAGLVYYQPVFKRLALNAYAGVGDEPFEMKDDVVWYVGKAQLDVYFGKWTVAPGYAYKHAEPYSESRHYGYLRVDYKIFD